MDTSAIFNNAVKTVKANSPEILTALGISGLIGTAYLAAKAAWKANDVVADDILDHKAAHPGVPYSRTRKESVKLVWKLYIPAAGSGILTIACIVGASKANGKRTAAAVTAYSLTERAFSEYRDKVVEQIGKGKEQKIRDEVAQDRVSNLSSKEVIITSGGNVLCCELYTHRYFRSDMESLRKAQNDLNALIVSEMYVTLDEFYDIVGIPHTSVSDKLGWTSEKLLELIFSTVMSEEGEPCLAFDYNHIKPL